MQRVFRSRRTTSEIWPGRARVAREFTVERFYAEAEVLDPDQPENGSGREPSSPAQSTCTHETHAKGQQLMLAEIFGPDGLIVLGILLVVLLFGGAQLPKLARGLGTASHEFRKGVAEGEGSSSRDDAATTSEPTKD